MVDRWPLGIIASLVFLVAVLLRIPSCYESFWLDELHSAWVVWGALDEVAGRAAAGHQSPLYFWALWIWKQVVGGGELGLRLSSVLLVATAASVATVGVGIWSRSLAGAAAAGGLLAIESNALFFGTELRPYAAVILCGSVAVVCSVQLLSSRRRQDHRRCWSVLLLALFLAALCQPTSIAVLAWLPVVLLLLWLIRDRQSLLSISRLDAIWLAVGTTVVATIWISTVSDSWNQRSMWSAFARATHFDQFLRVWEWTWLAIVPATVSVAAVLAGRLRQRPPAAATFGTWLLLFLAAGITASFWLVSWSELAPIWHRRYFVAVLPMLAVAAGGAVGSLHAALRDSGARGLGGLVGAVAVVVIVIGLSNAQGTLRPLTRYPVALVYRGEDWRDAVRWLNTHSEPEQWINLDSDLIEAKSLPREPDVTQVNRTLSPEWEYLTFPVRGPYALDRPTIPVRDLASLTSGPTGEVVVLSRRPASRIAAALRQAADETLLSRVRLHAFGNISVLVIGNPTNP